MERGTGQGDGHRRPLPRVSVPDHETDDVDAVVGMTHAEFVEALRAIEGLVDVTGGHRDRPNFHLRRQPFLHFHVDARSGGMYADVRFGGRGVDFEPVWASTPRERQDLLRQVRGHVRRIARR